VCELSKTLDLQAHKAASADFPLDVAHAFPSKPTVPAAAIDKFSVAGAGQRHLPLRLLGRSLQLVLDSEKDYSWGHFTDHDQTRELALGRKKHQF